MFGCPKKYAMLGPEKVVAGHTRVNLGTIGESSVRKVGPPHPTKQNKYFL